MVEQRHEQVQFRESGSRGPLRRAGASLWSWPNVVVAVTIVVLVAANIAWLWRFRYGFPLDVDEAGYLSTALNNTAAFESGGLRGLWDAFMLQTPQAPLVPLLTVPFQLLFGYRIFPGFLLQECFFALLALSSYGIGRRLTTPAYGALTALAVATVPMVTDLARHYIFAIDNAALVTAAVFALLTSDRLGRRGWALLFGALLGLGLLARTMTLGFAPGVVVAAVLLVVTARDRRGVRSANLGLGLLVGVAVAAPWYVRNLSPVMDYLLSYGYGNQSLAYGESYPLLSWSFWTFEINNAVNNGLYVPLAAVLAASSLVGMLAVARRRSGVLDFVRVAVGHESFAVAVVVGAGYLALSSTSNTGNAFVLPLLPLVVALGVALLWRVDWRPVRVSLVVGLVAVSILNAVMKVDLVPALSAERTVAVPVLGSLHLTDGRGVIQVYMENQGYEVGPATSTMPEIHRRWLPVSYEVARFLVDFSAAHDQAPVAYFSFHDPLFNTNTLRLAASLKLRRALYPAQLSDQLPADVGDDRVAAYRQGLSNPQGGGDPPNFLITGDPPPREFTPPIEPSEVEEAARSLGFEMVKTVPLPGGREARIWWLDRVSAETIDKPADSYCSSGSAEYGYVDLIQPLTDGSEVKTDGRVLIGGWAATPDGSPSVEKVEVRVEGEAVGPVRECMAREDLVKAFGEDARYGGWEVTVDLGDIEVTGPTVDVSAVAIDRDGGRHPLPRTSQAESESLPAP